MVFYNEIFGITINTLGRGSTKRFFEFVLYGFYLILQALSEYNIFVSIDKEIKVYILWCILANDDAYLV